MADRPIIMSAPMVLACLREADAPGTGKTQTRRVLKPQPGTTIADATVDAGSALGGIASRLEVPAEKLRQPYAVGDRLWVREAWRTSVGLDKLPPSRMERPGAGMGWPLWYRADQGAVTWRGSREGGPAFVNPGRARSAIHMPHWASRLTLTVTDVRVQRLQDISEEDAKAEGVKGNAGGPWGCEGLVEDFAGIWDSLHGPGAWDANPWVAAITFISHRANIDPLPPERNPVLAMGAEG